MALLRFCVVNTFLGLNLVDSALQFYDFVLLVLTTLLIAAGGYVINDYYDLDVDRINKPDKVIVGKDISIKGTRIYYWLLTIPGIIIGFYLAYKVEYVILGFIFPAVAIMLWSYSVKYQKTILMGNLMISSLSALVIIVQWLYEFFALKADPIQFVDALSQIKTIHIIVAGYALFAFFISLLREIIKDNEDIEGDREGAYKTFAIVFGKTYSRNVAVILHVFSMGLLAFAMYLLYTNDLLLVFWYLTIAVQLLFFFVLYYLITAKFKKDYQFLSNAYKIIMLAGILSMQLFYISF